MERLFEKIPPIENPTALQMSYDKWRDDAGIIGESKANVLGALKREVWELEDAIKTKDVIDAAGEVADVFTLGMTMLELHGLKLDEVPLVVGKPAASFEELQNEAHKLLGANGIHSPYDNLKYLLNDIMELSNVIDLNPDQAVEISIRMLLDSVMIIDQLGLPIDSVLIAKLTRNNIKYDPQKLKTLRRQGYTMEDSLKICREEWDSNLDREIFMSYLDIN